MCNHCVFCTSVKGSYIYSSGQEPQPISETYSLGVVENPAGKCVCFLREHTGYIYRRGVASEMTFLGFTAEKTRDQYL